MLISLPGGGNNRWEVYLDGLNKNVISNYNGAVSKTAQSVVTVVGGQTIIVTATGAAKSSSGGGASKAGIAAGVVVGLVALAGIVGGIFFFLRYQKRKAAEEEYKRAAAISDFVGKPPPTASSSINDSRLDPNIMFRRQSDASIADNQDYSRRILQVHHDNMKPSLNEQC